METANGTFAVKYLNPNIMKRSAALGNFLQAEALENRLEEAGLPIVAAVTIGERKLQELDGAYFYVFPWRNGEITDWYRITPEQCRMAGSIQGRIHAIDSRPVPQPEPVRSAVDWAGYIEKAAVQNCGIETLLRENEALLNSAERALNEAKAALPGIESITDEDMDPKNVLWEGDRPYVIDLECLEYGNPVNSAIQLALQWAGAATCDLDFGKLKAFFDGYLEAYDNGFRDYDRVFGLAYTWIEWLEYNLNRALGSCLDEAERELGLSQVRCTIDRIRYLRDREAEIKQQLRLWFRPQTQSDAKG